MLLHYNQWWDVICLLRFFWDLFCWLIIIARFFTALLIWVIPKVSLILYTQRFLLLPISHTHCSSVLLYFKLHLLYLLVVSLYSHLSLFQLHYWNLQFVLPFLLEPMVIMLNIFCMDMTCSPIGNALYRERILEYRDESQRLDQCSRLYDSSVSNDGLELDASHIVQVNPPSPLTFSSFDIQHLSTGIWYVAWIAFFCGRLFGTSERHNFWLWYFLVWSYIWVISNLVLLLYWLLLLVIVVTESLYHLYIVGSVSQVCLLMSVYNLTCHFLLHGFKHSFPCNTSILCTSSYLVLHVVHISVI